MFQITHQQSTDTEQFAYFKFRFPNSLLIPCCHNSITDFLSATFQTLKIVLTLTVSQIDWIMNLWNEDIYAVINKKKTTTTKKEDTPAPQIAHR